MGWIDALGSPAALRSTLADRAPAIVVAALAVLLAIQAAVLLTPASRPRPARSATAPPAALAAPVQVPLIVAAHLFGESREVVSDANAPQTSAQLVLGGVVAVPDPQRGLAVIGTAPGSGRLYSVGSALPGGVRLHAVYRDRVLLDRDGAIEALLLPQKFAPIVQMTATPQAMSPGQRLMALAQGNGSLLGGVIRAQAVFAGGKLSGYRIYPGGRAGINSFTQLGLRPGDLVTAINGTTLDDPARGNEILQTLSSAASADLTIQRNGQSQELNLNLQSVVNEAESATSQAAAAERRGGAFGAPTAEGLQPGGISRLPGSTPGAGIGDNEPGNPPPPPEAPAPSNDE